MIHRLIILLLIVGCGEFEDEGICVLTYTETNSYICYPDISKSHCIADAENDESILIRYWGESSGCNEYCNNQLADEICEIH